MADDTGLPHELPFPEATDPPNGPAQIEALADQVAARLGFAGKCIVAAEQARTNTAYGLHTTPDRVQNVVVPTDALVLVWYQAMWRETVAGAAQAQIFVGSNEIKWIGSDATGSTTNGAVMGGGTSYVALATGALGLVSGDGTAGIAAGSYATTGHAIGVGKNPSYGNPLAAADAGPWGGACSLFLAAGTYDISVQFKASSGSVSAKDRRLWVRVLPF